MSQSLVFYSQKPTHPSSLNRLIVGTIFLILQAVTVDKTYNNEASPFNIDCK
jgi:hypothetical protein